MATAIMNTTTGIVYVRSISGTISVASISASGQFIGPAADNTAAPPFSFLNDLNTGIGSSAADTVNIVTGGTSRVAVSTSAVTSTVPIVVSANGTVTDPAVTLGSDGDGFYRAASTALGISLNNDVRMAFDGSGTTYNLNLLTSQLVWGTGLGNSFDVSLSRLAADTLGQYRSTNAQRNRIFNTFTSASNNESFDIDWQTTANVALVGTRTAATGTVRPLMLVSQNTNAADAYTAIRVDGSGIPRIRMGAANAAGSFGADIGGSGNWIQLADFTNALTSGTHAAIAITPTYNQTSGTAANTDLLINRTQTAVGSGAQLLIDAQVGNVSKFSVSNAGVGTFASDVISTNSITAGADFNLSWNSRVTQKSPADALFNVTNNAGTFGIQINTGTAAPTFNNGTIDANSRNTCGQVTLTGANTGGTVTFGTPAWTNTPYVVVTGTAATDTPHITARSTTAFTVAGITANGAFTYVCIGRI